MINNSLREKSLGIHFSGHTERTNYNNDYMILEDEDGNGEKISELDLNNALDCSF